MSNPLVAQAQSQTTAVTGIGIAESAVDLASGVKDGSWVEFGMGALGVGMEALSVVMDPIGTLAQYGASWLIEHVQPLKEALDWLAGDPPVIQSYSDTWANVAKEVGAVAGDLSNEAKNATAGWSGDGGDAYRRHVAEQTDAIAGASTLADGISTGVMVMGQVVAMVRETVRDLVAELVGKLISWVLEEACTLGFATPLVAAQATTAITNTISKVSDLVRKLIKTIGNVSPKIRKIVDKLGEIIEKLSKLGKKFARRADGATTPSHAASHVDTPNLKGDVTTPSHAPDGATTPSSAPDTKAPDGPGTRSPDSTAGSGSPDTGAGPGSAGDSSSPGTKTSDGSLRGDAQNPRDRAQPPEGRCEGREPVDLASGEMYLTQVDVELPGVLPLVLGRVHVSSYRSGRLFGSSWASTVDQRLEIDERGVCFADPDGVILVYPPVTVGAEVFPEEGARWPLTRTEDGGFVLRQPKLGRALHFGRARAGRSPISAVSDRHGNRIDFDYDSAGVLAGIRHTGGYEIDVATEGGLVTELRLRTPGGQGIPLTRYGYDGSRNLTDVVNSSGRALRFDYDLDGRITKWTDRNGEWYGYTYDSGGRCVRTDGSGNVFAGTIEFDPDARVTRETDSLGNVTSHHFNDSRQLIRRLDALGNETRFEWDRYDRLLAKTDPLGRRTSYLRDEDGNIVTTTRPDGTRLLAEYNVFGLPVRQVDPDGAVWLKEYDDRANLLAVTDPSGATARYEYHENGGLAAVTDAVGSRQRLEVDAAGLSVAVTDADGATTRYFRDQFGRVHRITDPLGAATALVWTVEGKLLSRTQPDGATETWRYDAEGNEVEHVDAVGRATRTETTHFDLPAKRRAPDGAVEQFGYDSELRLVSVTDPRGLVWRYEYDAVGNLVRETDFDGRVVTYVRDGAGQVAERIDNTGQRTSYLRDALGQVLERSTPSGVSRFAYDAAGRMTSATNADAETVFERDALGRVLAETTHGHTVASRYDAVGRRTMRRTPTGAESVWTYDGNHRPTVLRGGDRMLSFGYDRAGREVERLLDTGTILAQSWDQNHRLLSQTVSSVAGAGQAAAARRIQQRRYHYRPDGYLDAVEDQLAGARRLELDAAGRPVSVRGGDGAEQYSYDPAGNVTAAAVPGADPDVQGAREYTGTLLSRAGNTYYRYDERGRVVVRERRRRSRTPEVWRYTWDAEDRLVAVSTSDGSRWRYAYDALGRRIAKQRLAADGTTVLAQTRFVWDGTVLAEQIQADAEATTWEHEPHGFRALTQRHRVRTASSEWVDREFYSIVTDLVGTPVELVSQDGSLAWQARSRLWGAVTARAGRADTPLRFPGQYFDAETGLHYNYQRYYDPELARYSTDDSLGLAPAPNPRTYVGNPTRYIDPLGLTPAPGGAHGPGTGTHTTPPPPQNMPGPISMDDAVDLGARHVGGVGEVRVSGSEAHQFIRHSEDAAGRRITSIARFDINPAAGDVVRNGPHLNLETQINGRPVRTGPYADPHIPIDPTTIRPGDIPNSP